MNILDKILSVKQREVASIREKVPQTVLQEQTAGMEPCRDFQQVLTRKRPGRVNVIAEIKRASPSAGLIREDFEPAALAQLYASIGADAISVLTDESFFQGRLEYLTAVKDAVELPVLRKDFIIDPYQVYEARAAGADAILLIAEALTPEALTDLLTLAHELTLGVLLEVHQRDSLTQVVQRAKADGEGHFLLGINNRNLKTMQTDLRQSLRLGELIENKRRLVSESGIRTRQDVERLIEAQFNTVLIGETLMRADNIADKFVELFAPEG